MIRAWLQRHENQARRMGRMMDRLDVDVADLATRGQGQVFRRAMSTCAQCNSIESCERALADWEAGNKDAANPADFCPNAERFAQSRRQE
jgi:hypothetical protein